MTELAGTSQSLADDSVRVRGMRLESPVPTTPPALGSSAEYEPSRPSQLWLTQAGATSGRPADGRADQPSAAVYMLWRRADDALSTTPFPPVPRTPHLLIVQNTENCVVSTLMTYFVLL